MTERTLIEEHRLAADSRLAAPEERPGRRMLALFAVSALSMTGALSLNGAFAQGDPMTGAAPRGAAGFATVDADGSGGLSLAEVQAAMPDVSKDLFELHDADGSGDLSAAEFNALLKARME